MLALTIESISSCFLTHYMYTTHAFVVKLDDVRTRGRCFACWALSFSHYVRYPTYTVHICCLKENRLVVEPFTANSIFRIMEITFTLGHFLIYFQFPHILSISPYCSYARKFHPQKIYRSMLS